MGPSERPNFSSRASALLIRLVFAPSPDSSSDAARVTTHARGRSAKHLALENVPVLGSAATARVRALVDAADAEAAQRGAAVARAVDVACMVLVGLHVPSLASRRA